VSILRRLRHRDVEAAESPFRKIAARELAFLERDAGFGPPTWEPFPHAEEILTYERDATQIRIHLGDSARGIEVELVSADGIEQLELEDWFHSDNRPWAEETRRILASYARLLRARGIGQENGGDG
jgi:hypothetical protein